MFKAIVEKSKDALLGVLIVIAYLFTCALSDDFQDRQIAQAELVSAQADAIVAIEAKEDRS